jgi:hypothetical protein
MKVDDLNELNSGYFSYFENNNDHTENDYKLIKNSAKYSLKITKQEIYKIFKIYLDTLQGQLLYDQKTSNNFFDIIYQFLLHKYKI